MGMAGRLLFAVMLSACASEGVGQPDSGAAQDVMPQDAAPQDAAPDADPCWMRIVVQCVPEELIQLCVPRVGCAVYACDGEGYAYCGPG